MKRREFLRNAIGASVALGGLGPLSTAHAWNAARMRRAKSNRPAISVLTNLGLTSNLKMCVDAGDANSIRTTSPQIWYDTSGNTGDPSDPCFGGSSGGTSNDPSFAGTVGGLSSSEYILSNATSFMRPNSGVNPTWINSLHRNNVQFTLVAWVYFVSYSAARQAIFGTGGGGNSMTGVRWNIAATTGDTEFFVTNGSLNAQVSSTLTGTLNGWGMYALSLSVSGGAYSAIHYKNGTAETSSGSYGGTIGTGNASYDYEIGAAGNAGARLENLSRMAMFMGWFGQSLTSTQLDNIFQRTRGRFGV